MFEKLFDQNGLSLERLKAFVDIVEAGGITAASNNDSNRQSQLSRQLKDLERFFGVELMRRGRGKMKLTAAGGQLHKIISHSFGAWQDFRSDCSSQPVELAVGAGESLIQWMLLPRLSRVMKEHPRVTLEFQNMRTEEIYKGLLEGTLDFGVVSRTQTALPLESVPLGQVEYGLFVPAQLIGKTKTKVTDDILGRVPLAMLKGGDTIRLALETLAKERRFKLDVRLRLTSYPQLAAAVLHSEVAAIMPVLAADAMPGGMVQMIRLPFMSSLSRRISLVWNRQVLDIRPAIGVYSKILAKGLRA